MPNAARSGWCATQRANRMAAGVPGGRQYSAASAVYGQRSGRAASKHAVSRQGTRTSDRANPTSTNPMAPGVEATVR
jgi:hypothetical protein